MGETNITPGTVKGLALPVPQAPPHPFPKLLAGVDLFQFAHRGEVGNGKRVNAAPPPRWSVLRVLESEFPEQPNGGRYALDSWPSAALRFRWE